MNKLTILVPTRNRIIKLKKMLDSIPKLGYIDIMAVCDGDPATHTFLSALRNPKILSVLIQPQRGAVYCRNAVSKNIMDGLLYTTDDIIFQENAIQNAFECFNKNFPDDDGVVGFVQEGNIFHPVGVALVGQKFLQRYPDKQLFYPGYFHFSCQEVYDLCQKLGGKFVQEKQASVLHRHPCNFPEEIDQTHHDARVRRREDHKLIKERKQKGLIWGLTHD